MDRGAWWATVHGVAKSQTRKWLTLSQLWNDSSFVGCPFSLGLPDVFLWLGWGYLFFWQEFQEMILCPAQCIPSEGTVGEM